MLSSVQLLMAQESEQQKDGFITYDDQQLKGIVRRILSGVETMLK
jgi:hypothetical protein